MSHCEFLDIATVSIVMLQVPLRDRHCPLHEAAGEQGSLTRPLHDPPRLLYHETQQHHRNDGMPVVWFGLKNYLFT